MLLSQMRLRYDRSQIFMGSGLDSRVGFVFLSGFVMFVLVGFVVWFLFLLRGR